MGNFISGLVVIAIYFSFVAEMENAIKMQYKKGDYFAIGLICIFIFAPTPVVLDVFHDFYLTLKNWWLLV